MFKRIFISAIIALFFGNPVELFPNSYDDYYLNPRLDGSLIDKEGNAHKISYFILHHYTEAFCIREHFMFPDKAEISFIQAYYQKYNNAWQPNALYIKRKGKAIVNENHQTFSASGRLKHPGIGNDYPDLQGCKLSSFEHSKLDSTISPEKWRPNRK